MSTYMLAAGWLLYTTGVHAFIGERRVMRPLRGADIVPFSQATLFVVWHAVTWMFLTLVAALVVAAFVPALRLWAPLAALQLGGFALVFAGVARRTLGGSIFLPQWLLLGPFAVLAAAALGPHANALATTALLSSIAGVHLLWALGTWWPAPSREALALHVIGCRSLPGPAACLVVASALLAFAWLFAVGSNGPGPRAARVVVVALFAARGLLGFFEASLRPRIAGTPFASYSRYLYSPLSLLIACVAAMS